MDSDSGAAPLPVKTSWTRWLLLTSILLLIAAVVLPPLFNISRYKRRIAASISSSIGRPVHMSTVRLHLLPMPGFEIANFEVEEDPAFGSEPTLRSASVVASIRLSSLWRGRLEISRISLVEPSFNLVRDGQGSWNLESVLVKATQSEIAPTEQRRPGSALRFPYIVATNARINFKQGYEKKPFSFLNTDVSVWLDKPDEWKLRFEGQPARTDLNMGTTDTGIVRMEGTFRRATDLQQVPMVLHVEWSGAPLGQLSRLLADRDMGWRGDLEVRADLTGTPGETHFKTRVRANGVHRLEFAPLDLLDLDATCQGNYFGRVGSLEDLFCTSPIGRGNFMLTGAVHTITTEPQPDVKLHMEKVPAAALLETMRSIRSDFAPSLGVRGTMDGDFRLGPTNGFSNAILDGSAAVHDLELTSQDLKKPLLIPLLKLATNNGRPAADAEGGRHHRRTKFEARVAVEPALLLERFAFSAGATAPLSADGSFTRSQFSVHLEGPASIEELAGISKTFGGFSPVLEHFASQGNAELNLTIRGLWLLPIVEGERGVSGGVIEGSLGVKDARYSNAFLTLPIDVASATANFADGGISWGGVSFKYAGLRGDGSLRSKFPCPAEKDCETHFDLRFPTLDAGSVETAMLGGNGKGSALRDLLARLKGPPQPWPRMSGTVSAGTFTLSEIGVRDARAAIVIEGNHVQVDSFDGRALGGTLRMGGAIEYAGGASTGLPHYAMDVEISKANAGELSALFHEKWGGGQLNLTTHLDLNGYSEEELASSATGNFRWDWTHGSLLTDSLSPLGRFERWKAEGTVARRLLTLADSTLTRTGKPVVVSGSISFARALHLHLGNSSLAADVTGTAQAPLVRQGTSSHAVYGMPAPTPLASRR